MLQKGAWMRICDVDGNEQSSVMVIDDYTFYIHSFEDGKPMLIDYEHELGSAEENVDDVCELARKLQAPADDTVFAAGGTQLLKAGVA